MSGYLWDPVVKIVPRNGAERTIVFSSAFSDLVGHERADVRYIPEKRDRRDVNRSERPTLFGWRPEVRFDFAVMTMADQHSLAEIQDALMSERVDVHLAMDSVTFRRVVLASDDGPDPIAGKTFAGARFKLGVRCADLLTERPRMGATTNPSAREMLQDGGFEQWVSASELQAWTASTAGGTLDREASIVYAGTYAGKLTRSGAGDLGVSEALPSLEPGRWYRLRFRSQLAAASASATIVRCELKNVTRALWITDDGKTWSASSGAHVIRAASTLSAWTEHSIDFRASSASRSDDAHNVKLLHGDAAAILGIVYDDASLSGPVLPSGVSLW